MRGAWIPALAVTAVLAGCGSYGQKRGSEESAAVRALEGHMSALQRGDLKAAYEGLSWRRREQFKFADLQANYAAHRELYQHRAEGKVVKTFYDDFRVVAKVVNGDGAVEFISMVPEGGGWRVEDAGQTLAEICGRTGSPGRR